MNLAATPAGRPDWVKPARSAASFWLPSGAVLVLTLLLLVLWPHEWRTVPRRVSLPEATASYVLLDGSVPAVSANPLGNPWPGPRATALPERDPVVVRPLPAPAYTGTREVAPWSPVPLRPPSNAMPDLAARPVADLLTGAMRVTNRLAVTLSPGLQRRGFRFDLPPGIETGTPAVVRFFVELDDKGAVSHLLAEPGDNPASRRLLETAVGRGLGSGAGQGQIEISWDGPGGGT
jgi:hypothetical protein